MANTYIALVLGGGGSDDRRLKVSTDDTAAGFLEEKLLPASNKITVATDNPGGAEVYRIDVDETNIDHDILLNFEEDEHRPQDDTATTTTSLWSSQKTQDELDLKVNKVTPVTDNTLVKSIGTSGVDFEVTGVIVDDSNNISGVNDLVIDGNLTVNGDTTTSNTATLEVEDANITINKNGTEATADAQDAGLTVEMSDATDVSLGFDSTTTSKMRVGEVGDEREIATISHVQELSNKTINADVNTISELEVDNLKAGVLVVDLEVVVDNNNIAGAQAVKDYVVARVAEKDEANEIAYAPTTAADYDVVPSEVASALDELASRTNTTEDTLADHLNGNPSKHNANQINNTASGNLTSTNVQNSLVELQLDIDTRASSADLTAHLNDTEDAHDASAISNVPSGNLAADNVQDALNELDVEKYAAADFDGDFDTRLATKDTDNLTEGVTNLYFTEERAYIENGDIPNTEFTFADNISTLTNITGLSFGNGVVRAFEILLSVDRQGDGLFEEVQLRGIQKASGWDMSVESAGDDTGLEFDINASGQVQYTSSDLTSGGTIVFRAKTTSI